MIAEKYESQKAGVMSDPLVSIIIPTYNQARWLKDAVESALSQTYKAVEVIVVNDGSTDTTSELLRTYDGRVRVYEQANAGLSAARNAGIIHSLGDYLVFLDSDDWLKNEFVETRLGEMRRGKDVGLVLGSSFWHEGGSDRVVAVESALLPRGEAALWMLRTMGVPILQSAIVSRDLACAVGGFDSMLRYVQDFDFWLKIGMRTGCIVSDVPLSYYRQHSEQMTRSTLETRSSVERWKMHWYAHLVGRNFYIQNRTELHVSTPPGGASTILLLDRMQHHYLHREWKSLFWFVGRLFEEPKKSAADIGSILVFIVAACMGSNVLRRVGGRRFSLLDYLRRS